MTKVVNWAQATSLKLFCAAIKQCHQTVQEEDRKRESEPAMEIPREQFGCLKTEKEALPAKEKAMSSWRWAAAVGGRYLILPWLMSSCVKYWTGVWGWSTCSMIPEDKETCHEH